MTTQNPFCGLLQGRQLHQYLISDYLGGGEFSLVLKGQDLNTGKPVAVKVLLPGSSAGAQFEFEREAELLTKLRAASNVINLQKSGTDQLQVQLQAPGQALALRFHYHALDLADGTLEEKVSQRGSITLAERLALWRSVVRGVHQMHRSQIVHRDLKSANCLVFAGREMKERVQVCDLGRAGDTKLPHHFRPQAYETGRGDYRFAPPECLYIQARTDRASCKNADLYGLGSLLFELVTGVGITAAALGYGPDILAEARRELRSGRLKDLSALRRDFDTAFMRFEADLPDVIRAPAGALLRQLCDPDPESRTQKLRFGAREVAATDLQWLLRRADIICSAAQAARSKKLKPRKVVS